MFCLLNFLFANPLNLGEENTFVGLDIRKRDRFVQILESLDIMSNKIT